MKRTIFRTPLVSGLLHYVSRGLLKLSGWRILGEPPADQRYVLIGAPHTSNWDFIVMLLAMFLRRMEVRWMGKDALFPWPFAGFMKWLGGIPIDRSRHHGTVEQMIEHYRNNDELVVLIPPEGTRKKVERWKTGFYHIAHGAGVPILLGYIDAGKKEAGFGPLFHPTGDLLTDMQEIQAYYADKQAIRPDLF